MYIHILRLVAKAIDPAFHAKLRDIVQSRNGALRSAPVKGDDRIRSKCLSKDDYRYKQPPRPAQTLGAGGLNAAVGESLGPGRRKNSFHYSCA